MSEHRGDLREDCVALVEAGRAVREAFLDALDAGPIGRFVRWLNDRLTR